METTILFRLSDDFTMLRFLEASFNTFFRRVAFENATDALLHVSTVLALMSKKKKSIRVPHVALLIETSKSFGREILLGIGRYSRIQGPWSIFVDEFGPGSKLPGWLKTWKGDGIIMRARNRKMAKSVAELGVPIVDTLQPWPTLEIGGVFTDDEMIGRLAADHLLERRLRDFAFVGVEGAQWSRSRRDGFVSTIKRAGFDVFIYSPVSRRRFRESWEGGQQDLADWLEGLPKPVGLMTAHDMRALCVFDACRRQDISIPEEIAIIGVDDDEVISAMADTPLSSVGHNGERIGFEAASWLDRVMRGEGAANTIHLVPPRLPTIRRSTDIVAVSDPALAKSLKYIRDRKGNTTVQQVANYTGLSRRSLERKFAENINSTPHEQIANERLNYAKLLLRDTNYSLESIAEQMELSSASYLSTFFKELTGITPGDYRQQTRVSDLSADYYPVSY